MRKCAAGGWRWRAQHAPAAWLPALLRAGCCTLPTPLPNSVHYLTCTSLFPFKPLQENTFTTVEGPRVPLPFKRDGGGGGGLAVRKK